MNCLDDHLSNQATNVVNGYIDFWNCKTEQFPLKQLDTMYYYLIWAHKNNVHDIFNHTDHLYYILFLA